MTPRLRIHATDHPVSRSGPSESWRADVACPICGLRPIRVRTYEERVERQRGTIGADAWCAGRHDAPVGVLVREASVPSLSFMGVGEPEVFRARVYGSEKGV